MAEVKQRSPFSYRPNADAVKKRLAAEAEALYRAGLENCRHQPIADSYDSMLRKFYLYITLNCPMKCAYCYATELRNEKKSLDADVYLRMTQEAIDAGYREIVLVGGEPLVYHDWNRYMAGLEQIDKHDSRFILRTSLAFPVCEKLMENLCRVFDEIVVSLDGDEATHDAKRGAGTWKQVTENIERTLALGANISINAVLDGDQQRSAPGAFLKEYCHAHGIQKYKMESAVPMGRAAGTKKLYAQQRSSDKTPEHITPVFNCGIGHSLYVQSDGKVYPCYAWCEEEHCLGDLSTESVQEILMRGKVLEIINSGVDTNRKCRSCDVRYFCGGPCKIWVNDKHDIDSEDFDCGKKRANILSMLKQNGIKVKE